MKTTIACIGIICFLFTASGLTDESKLILDKQQLEKTFSGNTAIGMHLQKNIEMRDYYSKKGHFVSARSNGDLLKGKWWVSKKRDAICVKYKHIPDKSFCRVVVADGKGGYDKIYEKDGKALVHYDSIVKGNKTKIDKK